MSELAAARRVLQQGMDAGLHVGAQLYVSVHGAAVAEIALGLSRPGEPMTRGSMMTWLSCSKIATSIAAARVWEAGGFSLDDPVSRHIPAFASHGKERITIRHLWTHTCGLHKAEQALFPVRYDNSFEDNIALICESEPTPGWLPGRRAGYQTSVMALLLAEIVRRHDGRPFPRYVREELFEPLGMADSWLGMPAEKVAAYGNRLGQTFDTSGATPKPGSWAPDSPAELSHVMPGGNGRGPMREFARLLELLLSNGAHDGAQLLSPQTVEALTARHRTGLFDESWQALLDWGLGLTLDSKQHHDGGPHLYGYGRHASPRAYGHSGFRTTLAFCDPEAGLVVTCSWNGMVADDEAHSQRQNELCDAVYEDLGLTSS